jgi:hypothetical protein
MCSLAALPADADWSAPRAVFTLAIDTALVIFAVRNPGDSRPVGPWRASL